MVVGVQVAVIGGGSWGTTIAHLCAHNTRTVLYARDHSVVRSVTDESLNHRYLPGCPLHTDLRATNDPAEAMDGVDVVVMAVPSHGFRAALRLLKPHAEPGTPVLSLAKGLEGHTSMRMTEIVADELPGHPVGVLTGPNLAKEIMAGHATAAVLAMDDLGAAQKIQSVLAIVHFRVYTGTDVVGAEMAGATKNVIALAAGMADGLGAGDNTKAALITRGLAEMTRLGVAAGGEPLTFSGLAGIGDLAATCISNQSRNRYVGECLGQGKPISEILDAMDQVAEGVRSTPVVVEMARSLNVDMPIAEEVRAVIEEGRPASEAYRALLDRPQTQEIRG